MALVVNTNTSATKAALGLTRNNDMLQRSLQRLSSGNRIVSPADDAGGLAVSMKLQAAIKRTDAVNTNIANSISFLQTQDGGMATATKILDRISELRTLYDDPTKNANDKSNYENEFDALRAQLTDIAAEKFNDVSLFGGSSLTVRTTEDGAQSISVTKAGVADNTNGFGTVANAANLNDISVANLTTAIQNIATLRATNGAETSRLQFASEMLDTNKTNLEAANSRIIDTDIASESTKFARFQILQQSGAAMLAQANASSQIALRLLG